MRNYWLKIALGALLVFAVGMGLIAAARAVRARLRAVARSSEPISIPLAFVPFRLNGDRLGTFDHAVLIRKSPRQLASIRLGVELNDSAAAGKLAGCDLLARLPPNPRRGGPSGQFSDADFACVDGDSVAGHGAERIGDVGFHPGGLNLALYVPAEVAEDLRVEWTDHAPPGTTGPNPDSLAAAAARLGDSIAQAAARMGDSMGRESARRGDSIGRAVHRHADSIRAAELRMRDSLRAAHQSP